MVPEFSMFLGFFSAIVLDCTKLVLLSNPAKDSQGHKLSSHLDKNSSFRLLHGQKCTLELTDFQTQLPSNL